MVKFQRNLDVDDINGLVIAGMMRCYVRNMFVTAATCQPLSTHHDQLRV